MRRIFTTDGIATCERLPFWNAVASRVIAPMTINAVGPAPFRGELACAWLGECELFSPRSTPATVSYDGTARPAGGSRAGRKRLLLMLQCAGRSITHLAGQEVALGPDDFVVLDPEAPYSIGFTEPTEVILASLSGDGRARRVHDLEPLIGAAGRGASGGPAVLAAFLRSAWANLDDDLASGGGEALSDVLWSLVTLAYCMPRPSELVGVAAQGCRESMRTFIEDHLVDPDLGAVTLARAFGVTPRYVQLLFSEIATTPSAYILDRRLVRAAEMLRTRGRGASITDVAFTLGFKDLSHFSRVFRKRFGVSPRAFLARAQA